MYTHQFFSNFPNNIADIQSPPEQTNNCDKQKNICNQTEGKRKN